RARRPDHGTFTSASPADHIAAGLAADHGGMADRAMALLFMSAVTCYLLGRVFVEAVTGPNPIEVGIYAITAAFGLEYLMASWRSLWVTN
ncbi:MAG TPA: hypothetical protein VI111_05440, partial [Thermoleophilaceae bacterium]